MYTMLSLLFKVDETSTRITVALLYQKVQEIVKKEAI